jgi:hypothetical protein
MREEGRSGSDRLSTATQRLRIPYGYLKALPDDYTGPRHIVMVKQTPPEELPPAERAVNWFEWEERPGPESASTASRPNDEVLVQVRYGEAKPRA